MQHVKNNFLPLCFFFSSVVTTAFIAWGFVRSNHCDLSMLINLGRDAKLKSVVIKDFGEVCLVNGIGHDGTLSYLIARDPFLTTEIPKKILDSGESVAYRYRRLLYSLLGGGFGYLSPQLTLYGLIFIGGIGLGLTAFGVSYMVERYRISPLLLLSVFANIGMLNSITTLTSDNLAIGLATIACIFFFHERLLFSTIFIALSILTKEYYLLLGISFFIILIIEGRIFQGIALMVGALLPIVSWIIYLFSRSSQEALIAVRSNITFPFSGVLESYSFWPYESLQDKICHGAAISLIILLTYQLFTCRSRNQIIVIFTLDSIIYMFRIRRLGCWKQYCSRGCFCSHNDGSYAPIV